MREQTKKSIHNIKKTLLHTTLWSNTVTWRRCEGIDTLKHNSTPKIPTLINTLDHFVTWIILFLNHFIRFPTSSTVSFVWNDTDDLKHGFLQTQNQLNSKRKPFRDQQCIISTSKRLKVHICHWLFQPSSPLNTKLFVFGFSAAQTWR